MFLNFIDIKTLFIIGHIVGAVLGAGGAFVSDAIFFSTVKDGIINKTEMRFISLGSRFVWGGLIILIISGIGLFFTNPIYYIASTKFISKIIIVGIITINGIIFHKLHIPVLKRSVGSKLINSKEFIKRSNILMISGAVSMVSWVATLVLGSLKKIPYGIDTILSVYLVILFVGICSSVIIKRRLFS